MKYAYLLQAVMGQFWAMHPDKLRALVDIVGMRVEGGRYTPSEIEARIGAAQEKQIARQQGDVMVLPLQGVISNRSNMVQDVSAPRGTSTEAFSTLFRTALNDDKIKAIVLDVNSPGGTVSGVEELTAEILEARGVKPVIAQVNAMAASAAYWIASAADEIVLTPSGEVGSIGVYSLHEDISQMLVQKGVQPTFISAGKYKVEANPFQPLTSDARASLQESVDAYYEKFIRAVAQGRGVAQKAVREGFGEGRMVRADKAIAEKMVDRVGTMRETLARLGINAEPKQQSQVQQSSRRNAAALQREIQILELSKI